MVWAVAALKAVVGGVCTLCGCGVAVPCAVMGGGCSSHGHRQRASLGSCRAAALLMVMGRWLFLGSGGDGHGAAALHAVVGDDCFSYSKF